MTIASLPPVTLKKIIIKYHRNLRLRHRSIMSTMHVRSHILCFHLDIYVRTYPPPPGPFSLAECHIRQSILSQESLGNIYIYIFPPSSIGHQTTGDQNCFTQEINEPVVYVRQRWRFPTDNFSVLLLSILNTKNVDQKSRIKKENTGKKKGLHSLTFSCP